MIQEAGFEALSLSYLDGWRAENLDFLLELPFVRCVQLFGFLGSGFETIDLSAVSQCVWLQRLTLDIDNGRDALPSLSGLTELEHLELALYRQSLASNLSNERLQVLHIRSSLSMESLDLTALRGLRFLYLRENKVLKSVALSGLAKLEEVGIYAQAKLSSVEGLSGVSTPCTVRLGKSKGLEWYNLPKGMRSLHLASMGKIPDLRFLANHQGLEEIYMNGTSDVVDGDLSVLLNLPKLRVVNVQNRRHYSHKQEEIRAVLRARR